MSGTVTGDDKRITFLTGVVRASYVNFLEARAVGDDPGAPKRFGASLIIDPGPDCDLIWSKICEAADKFFSDPQMRGADKLHHRIIHNPLRSGMERPQDAAYAGKMFINGGGKTPPLCYDAANNVVGPATIYSGCYVRAVLNLYAFNRKEKKGIGVGIQYVQFVRDGQPLGGGGTIEGGQKAFAAAPLPPGALPPAPPPGMLAAGTGYNGGAPAPGLSGGPASGYAAPPPGGYPQPGAPALGYPPAAAAPNYGAPAYGQQNGYPPGPPAAASGYPAGPPQNGYQPPAQQGYAVPAAPPAAPNGAYAPPPPAPGYPAPGQAPAYPPR